MYKSILNLVLLIPLIVGSYSSFSQNLTPEIINNKLCFDTIQAKEIAKHLVKSRGYDTLLIIAKANEDKCKEIIVQYKLLNDEALDIIETQTLQIVNLKAINKLDEKKIRGLKAQRILFIGAGLLASTFLVVIK